MGSPDPRLREDVIKFLDVAQSCATNHSKLLNELTVLYENTLDPVAFFKTFFRPLSNILLVYTREPSVERVVSFVAGFAVRVNPKGLAEENDTKEEYSDEVLSNGFFSLLVVKLLTLHGAKDKAVRFRVCQLVAKLMDDAVDASCILSYHLQVKIKRAMLIRIHDKVSVVRVHAVSALQYLQAADPECPVTTALLELLEKDSSPEVRRCVLNKIIVSDKSLTAVIGRTCDTKDLIRRDAYIWLSTKCSITNFSISSRVQLLRVGLKDLSAMVVEACVNGLLRSWSLECHDGNFIALLSRLYVESAPDVVELALVKLFDNFSMDELITSMSELIAASTTKPEHCGKVELDSTPPKWTPTTPIASLGTSQDHTPVSKLLSRGLMNSEEVFYWSCLCRYLHGRGVEGQEGLEIILPNLSEFCDYIQSYVMEVLLVEMEQEKKIQSHFVTEQLCTMLTIYDLSDEVGRSRLADMVFNILIQPDIPVSLTGPLLLLQTSVWPKVAYRIERLVEVIAEQRQPSVPGLSDSILDATNLSFLDLQDDMDTLLRCLAIACELLKSLRMQKLDNPLLLMLIDSLLFPCIQNESPYVRDMAIHCLGLACLLDLTLARKHILLFLQVIHFDHESVQATALKVVFDLLHIYGIETFNAIPSTSGEDEGGENVDLDRTLKEQEKDVEEERESTNNVEDEDAEGANGITQKLLNIMATFLDGESFLLRGIAGEGICKLLLSRRILSQKLLAKLLLLWYNPTTQEETELRSILGLFFLSFASLDRSSRLCLSEVYLPVLQMVLKAPPTSPLASVNTSNLSDFILHLTQPIQSDTNVESVHDSLAISVCNECLNDPQSTDCRVYCRTLSLMTLTPSNKTNASDLLALWEQMRVKVWDKTSLRYLNKLRDNLLKINPDYTVTSITTPIKSTNDDRLPVDRKTRSRVRGGAKVRSTAGRGRRKIRVVSSEEGEESESENVVPEDIGTLPKKIPFSRATKSAAKQRINADALQELNLCSEESDDSVLGEYSPFIKPRRRRRSISKPLQPLQYSDDEEAVQT